MVKQDIYHRGGDELAPKKKCSKSRSKVRYDYLNQVEISNTGQDQDFTNEEGIHL